MPKLVIWDLDGTLVDSLPATFAAFNDGLEPVLGRRLSPREIMAHFGPSELEIANKLVGPVHAERCYRRFLAAMADRIPEVSVYPGISETLRQLGDAGFTLAIFTGRARRGTEIILEHLELGGHFREVVTFDEVERPKPHPDGIQKILAAFDAAPSDAVMIGDSPMDMLAGRAAGVRTVGCTWDRMASRAALAEAQASHVIAAPTELAALLA